MTDLPLRALIGLSSLATLILFQSSAALAQNNQGASEPAWIEPAKFAVSAFGVIVAAFVFGGGLWQYYRAQQWKRAEFLANEIKELLSDPKAVNGLTMIDWDERCIKLDPNADPKVVTYRMQSFALLPHTLVEAGGRILIEGSKASSADQMSNDFTSDEKLIRDCYDALLDRLDRLGSYLETGLLSVSDMRPYLGYYIDDIASETTDSVEALWNIVLLTYVHFYNFRGIPILFTEFRHDISPNGHVFRRLIERTDKRHQKLAQGLAEMARPNGPIPKELKRWISAIDGSLTTSRDGDSILEGR